MHFYGLARLVELVGRREYLGHAQNLWLDCHDKLGLTKVILIGENVLVFADY